MDLGLSLDCALIQTSMRVGGESSQLEGWMFDLGPGQLLTCRAICLPWWQYEGRQGALSTGRLKRWPRTWSIAILCGIAICLPWGQYEGGQGVLSTGGQKLRPWTWSTAVWWSSVPANSSMRVGRVHSEELEQHNFFLFISQFIFTDRLFVGFYHNESVFDI